MADSSVAIIEDGHVHAHIHTFICVLLETCTCKYTQAHKQMMFEEETCKHFSVLYRWPVDRFHRRAGRQVTSMF